MSAYSDSYKTQLQGVSQQLPRERLEGYLTEQLNMVSDPVTGLRRRPGSRVDMLTEQLGYTIANTVAFESEIAGITAQVMVNTTTGRIVVADRVQVGTGEFSYIQRNLGIFTYLSDMRLEDFQYTSVGDDLFLLNKGKRPTTAVAGVRPLTPDRRGFAVVRAGSFNTTYTIRLTITDSAGVQLYTQTASYTTPDATTSGAAAASTAEQIAATLTALLTATTPTHHTVLSRVGPSIYFENSNPGEVINISTETSPLLMNVSTRAYVSTEGDLPSRLPDGADGFIVSVGTAGSLRYYKYKASTTQWIESAEWSSPTALLDMPLRLTRDVAGIVGQSSVPYEGRLAGDSDNNPNPEFVSRGITGMGSYQGRLVLMAQSLVCMSASSLPQRFYRSTVAALLDSDSISIGASAAAGASWTHAVEFAKNLILFANKYQAVIPGGNVAITPRTANVVLFGQYDIDVTSRPIVVGPSLLYCAPRSANSYGILEMLPSQSAEAVYSSQDSTAHLPIYFGGLNRFAMSSTVSNLALFAPSTDPRVLVVHEYTWKEQSKVQQSWHKWQFPYPVASAYFSGQLIKVALINAGRILMCVLDPRARTLATDVSGAPYLDCYEPLSVTDHVSPLPTKLAAFDPVGVAAASLVQADGALRNTKVQRVAPYTVVTTDPSFPEGAVFSGVKYTSRIVPSPPFKKDYKGVRVATDRMTILRFMVSTVDTGEFTVSISDKGWDGVELVESPVYYDSYELDLGEPVQGADSAVIVPCRTEASSTDLVITSDDVSEFNLIGLEFVARTHSKIRRRQG